MVAILTANSKFLEIQQQGGSATLSDLETVFKEELQSIEKGKREFKEKHMTKKIPSQHSFRFKQCIVIIQKIPTSMTENSTPSYTW